MNLTKYFYGFIFLIILLGSGNHAYSQKTRKQLENEKQIAVQKLRDAQKILTQTENKKKSNIGQLKALNYQINIRQSVIQTISGEIHLMNDEISELEIVINSLEDDLNNLKREYSSMVYTSYKANTDFRNLTFLFTSKTFNQLFMRIKYMEQYSEERKRQLSLIQLVRESLISQKVSLEDKKTEKDILLKQEVAQNQNLISLRKKHNRILSSLTNQETEIKKELNERKKALSRLDRLIADLVAKEIEKSSKGKSKDRIVLSGDQTTLSKAFESSYAKLGWPVNAGFISNKFGSHPHPVFKKRVMVPNDGIDIQTSENEQVRAVFSGEVKTVAIVPGEMKYVVIVQHGDYFTVYAKLKAVNVKMGRQINGNDLIGIVNTNQEGTTELQFQIWKNTKKLNPESWLVRK